MNILLVHGLGRTPVSFFGLAAALRQAGHRTRFFAYSPTVESLPRIVRRLTRHLTPQHEPVGLVGHSLGGLLLRMAVAAAPPVPVHRLVMLGTPNGSAHLARVASRWRAFRLLAGECGRFLADADAVRGLPVPTVPYTLIAGTAGPRVSWGPFGVEPNDGIVSVNEVRIRPGDTPLTFPAWHSFLMDDPGVKRAVVAAMMRGTGDDTPS